MSLGLFRKTSKTGPTGVPAENEYGRQLTAHETGLGKHRDFIGGLWEELGSLQFEFLKSAGLAPRHRLLDVGCGCLRGGVFFVPYLEPGHYYGIDINASLIEAGKKELRRAGALEKNPNLFVTDNFEIPWRDAQFEYALAVSVFTHLYSNHIGLCLKKVGARLAPGGKFFATFFQAPAPLHLPDIRLEPGGIVTHFDRDPFHYSFAEMEALASFAGLSVKLIGDWKHPRQQRMLCFSAG